MSSFGCISVDVHACYGIAALNQWWCLRDAAQSRSQQGGICVPVYRSASSSRGLTGCSEKKLYVLCPAMYGQVSA